MASPGKRTRLIPVLALSLLLLPTFSSAERQGRRAGSELERYAVALGLNASQLRAAARGEAAARLLQTQDSRDVAVAGIIGVRAPRTVAMARTLDDPAFIATGASRFGTFGDPPAERDVRAVAFDRSEYRDLRHCRPGDCDFKLSAGEMAAFARDVDWSAPNAKAQADEHLRTGLVRLVADYRRRGAAAMPTYNDGREVRTSDAFSALVAQSRELAAFAPELLRYLTTYPMAEPSGARNIVYWSENRVGRMRPTLTVNHVVTYIPPTGTAFLAKKQIYANHYFEGGLELLALVDADVPAGVSQTPNVYLIVVRRFRFDNLPVGLFNVRGRVRSQLVDATRADLVRVRAVIEKTPPPSGTHASPGSAGLLLDARAACEREHHSERRPFAHLALDGNVTAHCTGELTADRQTEPRAIGRARE